MIRENIEPGDLLSHVCYYRLCPETRVCYDQPRIDPTFWIKVLRGSGLGRLENERYGPSVDWERIALECAEHAWSCSHPGCGVAQLNENSESKIIMPL